MSDHTRSGGDDDATKREGPGRLHRDVPDLDRGTLVGRYVILDVLGEGGMGIVYSAYDPELDRKLAIKLLQAGKGSSAATGGQAYLVREAQAMARLSHPNVIAVHDVGTLPGDRVFVAMELVDGQTLRSWIDETRPWREVLRVLREAGAGLAAAHAVGLVHRDFKPDNVLVGSDGRVRVMDFGLARLRDDETTPTPASRSSDLQIESRSPLSESLTAAGTIMGTPAYMAPEIQDGLGADARSDQFAFGVALYECLFRKRPFDKKALVPPRDAQLAAKPPPEFGLPPRVQRAVMRAIAIDPAARFASMTELLDELEVAEHPGRRLAIAIAAVALVGIAGGAYALTRKPSTAPTAPCTGTERRLAGVWDAPVKAAVKKGFVATKKPYAGQAYAGLERALDGYVTEWTEATVGNCEATRIRGEQTEHVQTLRQSCLDQRLEEVHALTQILTDPGDSLVEKADKVVWELEPIKRCANVLALASPNEPSPANRAAYDELTKKIAFGRAQLIAGQIVAALTSASQVLEGAKKIHADDLESDALLVRGGALVVAGNTPDAVAALDEATWTAMRSRRDDIVVQAALTLAIAQAEQNGNAEIAEIWVKLSNAASVRIGIDKLFELRRLETQGVIDAQRSQYKQAVATHEQALAAAVAAFGPNSPALWQPESLLATTMSKAGGWVAAIPHLERALALREGAVGPDHPDVALLVSNLGACYDHAGDRKRAREMFDRALAVREKTYGPKSPFLVPTLNNLADFKMHAGDAEGALELVVRAKAIAEKIPGPTSPMYHVVETTRAQVLGVLHRAKESRTAFDAVIELEQKLKSPELATTLAARADLELAEHKWADAAAFEERSIAIYEATNGKDHLDLWKPLAGLATAKRALDPKADVKPLLERALALGTKAQLQDADMQPIRAALAKP